MTNLVIYQKPRVRVKAVSAPAIITKAIEGEYTICRTPAVGWMPNPEVT
jgi:hypothetical protein